MIFVTVGTHHDPFDRLVAAAAAVRAATGEPVRVQRGPSRIDPAGCEVVSWLGPDAWAAAVREARLVVTHAGPASIEAIVVAGTIPIVVPRRRLWREHVDDHQLAFARRIADRVHVVEDPADLPAEVLRHDAAVAALAARWRPGVPDDWVTRFDRLVAGAVRERR